MSVIAESTDCVLKGLCRVLNAAQEKHGGGKWCMRYIALLAVEYDLLTISF